MSIGWYREFLVKVRELRTDCADALRNAYANPREPLNTQPISRRLNTLERHWQKQFPDWPLPKRDQINRHLRFGKQIDLLDLMTKDIHFAEEKAADTLAARVSSSSSPYVDQKRIAELKELRTTSKFDLAYLLQLCEELNVVAEAGCHVATAALVRTLLNHVPPVFGKETFPEVANNYPGKSSFKAVAMNLQESSRKIVDLLLHTKVRSSESLPTATQVDFRNQVDTLLSEIVRLLRDQGATQDKN